MLFPGAVFTFLNGKIANIFILSFFGGPFLEAATMTRFLPKTYVFIVDNNERRKRRIGKKQEAKNKLSKNSERKHRKIISFGSPKLKRN